MKGSVVFVKLIVSKTLSELGDCSICIVTEPGRYSTVSDKYISFVTPPERMSGNVLT